MAVAIKGERLQEIRKDHGDTQEEMARKLGFSISTVRKWEQNCCDPALETIVEICRLYNVSADYLLGLTELDPLLFEEKKKRIPEKSRRELQLFEEFLIYRARQG